MIWFLNLQDSAPALLVPPTEEILNPYHLVGASGQVPERDECSLPTHLMIFFLARDPFT